MRNTPRSTDANMDMVTNELRAKDGKAKEPPFKLPLRDGVCPDNIVQADGLLAAEVWGDARDILAARRDYIIEAVNEHHKLREENERLRDLASRMRAFPLRHKPSCAASGQQTRPVSCDCGLNALLAEAEP